MANSIFIRIDTIESLDVKAWNSYLHSHPEAHVYHLFQWLKSVEDAYGYTVYFFSAYKYPHCLAGVLPLVCMRGLSCKKELVSIPYCDLGGVLADDQKTEARLIRESLKFGKSIGVTHTELRQSLPIPSLVGKFFKEFGVNFRTETRKVRMILALPASSEELFDSFKAKLRSQIRRPEKSGLYACVGGMELVKDFYSVFALNMRDLGSPVHSRGLMEAVIRNFEGKAQFVVVYKGKKPVATSMVVGFRYMLTNPWASALREYGRLSPNMLLYWTMLAYGCDHGYTDFDFGRSTPGEGTHKFKMQWGAKERPLMWHYFKTEVIIPEKDDTDPKSKFGRAVEYWASLPVWMTRTFGPLIRKHVSL